MTSETASSRRSLTSIIDEASTSGPERRTLATGFDQIDRVLGGGVRSRNLTLIGGAPGVGKTITSLQWARQMARDGARVIFACYEHDEMTLLSRLLHVELGEMPSEERMSDRARSARRILGSVEAGDLGLGEALAEYPFLAEPYRRVREYADRLWLTRASGSTTTLDTLAEMVGEDTDVLFVDYLQKVPLPFDLDTERERVTLVTQGLKELAMSANIAVVAVAAADREGLEAPRLRLHHLRGSSAVAYEADVVIMLNDKYRIVSRSQLTHDLTAAEGFKRHVVFSVEKNRTGADMVDVEFRKQFEYLRFDPVGEHVSERLIDERLYVD